MPIKKEAPARTSFNQMTNNILPQINYEKLQLLEDRADALLLEAEILQSQTELFLKDIQGFVEQLKGVESNG